MIGSLRSGHWLAHFSLREASVSRWGTLFLLLIASPQRLDAQGELLPVFHFNHVNGLSANNVLSQVVRDRNGFIWIGLGSGLDRFDGHGVKHYRNVPGDPNSLSSDIVYALTIDSKERLWIGTYETGLSLYDPSEDQFINMVRRNTDSSWSSVKGIYAIREDSIGNLWLATDNEGVACVTVPAGHFGDNLESLVSNLRVTKYHLRTKRNMAHDLCVWPDGRILVGSDSGIVVINPSTRSCSRIHPENTAAQLLDSVFVAGISPDGTGKLWIATGTQGLFLFDPATNRAVNYRHKNGETTSIKSNEVHHVLQARGGDLWVATSEGLDLMSPLTGHSIPYMSADPRLQASYCWWLSTDATGTLWAGTETDGLFMLSSKSLRYPLFSLADSKGSPRPFESIERDKHGALWVSSRGKLLEIDFPTMRIKKSFDVYQEYETDMRGYNPHMLYIDTLGNYWYGSYDHGLFRINATSGRTQNYTYQSAIGTGSSVRSIASAPGNDLWIGSNYDPLLRFECATSRFTFVKDFPTLYVYGVITARDGTLWISAEADGLIHFNPMTGGVDRYSNDPENPHSLNSGMVYGSYEDPSGAIWAGSGATMNRWDPVTRAFTHFLNPSITPKWPITPLGMDRRGHLWMECGDNISILKPSDGSIENLDAWRDMCGTPVDMDTLPDGTMLITGTLGINVFSPDSIGRHRPPPPLIITGLTINDERNIPFPIRNGAAELNVTYVENTFAFEFVATDIVAPDLVRYRYMLAGLDKDWVDPKERRYVRYAGLHPGTYIFKVKAMSSRNEWPDQEIALSVNIAPPWWRSAGAYALYALLMLTLVSAAYRMRLNRLRLKQQAEMEHFQAERLAEVDKLKSRFFTNVSHEFRTPLTLILGPSEDLLSSCDEPATRRKLQLIRTNAHRLQDMVTQLLDFSRLESGAMKLNVARHDIVRCLYRMTMSCESWAERKGVALQFQCDADSIDAYFDMDKLETILNNLLSNALKFTPEGGNVTVAVTQCGIQSSALGARDSVLRRGIRVSVSDTGPGIRAEHLPHIFDRFYRVAETRTSEGTGIGLALTKELVDLHRGTLGVESDYGRGTIFVFTLPIDKSAYRAEEVSTDQAVVQPREPRRVAPFYAGPEHDRGAQPADGKAIVLVVEDNADLRLYIREHLESGYTVCEAADGKEGFDRAVELVPDLVISDIMMPSMNGIDLCRALKKDMRTSHLPVILLTARAGTDSKVEGLETGADDYLTKPFDVKELAARARNLIEQRRELREKFSASVMLRPGEVNVISQEDAFLRALMRVVDERMGDEDFSVEQLGEALHMSRVQLHRKVTALTNLSASGFLRSMRLRRAMDLLEGKAGTVSEVAYRVGFRDPSHFSKRFHEQFGVSPIDVLRNSRNASTDNAG